MANLDIVNTNREKVGEVELPAALFEAEVNRTLLHEVVTTAQTNERAGTRAVKGRSAVTGGGRKPWKQKGTGRARAGSTRSPLWRSGGTTFGPKPKDYDVRMPRKKRRAALRAALTWKVRNGDLAVLEGLEVTEGKTREVASWLDKSGWREGGALLIHAGEIPLLSRAARNLEDVKVTLPGGLCVIDLFSYRHLLLTRKAFDKVAEELGK
jgi:large subunit ribosomal protein L4